MSVSLQKKEVPIPVCLCKFSQGLVVLSNGLRTHRATPAAGDSLRGLAPEFRKSLLVADTGPELFLGHLCSERGPCPERKECAGRAGGMGARQSSHSALLPLWPLTFHVSIRTGPVCFWLQHPYSPAGRSCSPLDGLRPLSPGISQT